MAFGCGKNTQIVPNTQSNWIAQSTPPPICWRGECNFGEHLLSLFVIREVGTGPILDPPPGPDFWSHFWEVGAGPFLDPPLQTIMGGGCRSFLGLPPPCRPFVAFGRWATVQSWTPLLRPFVYFFAIAGNLRTRCPRTHGCNKKMLHCTYLCNISCVICPLTHSRRPDSTLFHF